MKNINRKYVLDFIKRKISWSINQQLIVDKIDLVKKIIPDTFIGKTIEEIENSVYTVDNFGYLKVNDISVCRICSTDTNYIPGHGVIYDDFSSAIENAILRRTEDYND